MRKPCPSDNNQHRKLANRRRKHQGMVFLHLMADSPHAQAVYRALHGTPMETVQAGQPVTEVLGVLRATALLAKYVDDAGRWTAAEMRRLAGRIPRWNITLTRDQLGYERPPMFPGSCMGFMQYSPPPDPERRGRNDGHDEDGTNLYFGNGGITVSNDPVTTAVCSPTYFRLPVVKNREDLAYELLRHLEAHPPEVALMIEANRIEGNGADQILLKMLRELPEFHELEGQVHQCLRDRKFSSEDAE